jgi:hypothetical protein
VQEDDPLVATLLDGNGIHNREDADDVLEEYLVGLEGRDGRPTGGQSNHWEAQEKVIVSFRIVAF